MRVKTELLLLSQPATPFTAHPSQRLRSATVRGVRGHSSHSKILTNTDNTPTWSCVHTATDRR